MTKGENKRCNAPVPEPRGTTWPPLWLTLVPANPPSATLAPPTRPVMTMSQEAETSAFRPGSVCVATIPSFEHCFWCGGRRFWQSLAWPDVIRCGTCIPNPTCAVRWFETAFPIIATNPNDLGKI